jgi:2-polyprenyl-3-methyl-5-hydroxy-6-metoxy-1,4-benzoquinol methylase
MKILVAIANYGTKNAEYLERLLAEYTAMPYDVNIIILSNTPKNLGPDAEVLVGLPTKDPWSLPFGHKKIFADRIDDYDLFIYSEDDTLITTRNIESFLEVTKVLPNDKIAGFIRFEEFPSGTRRYPDADVYYHWLPDSVEKISEYTFAHFTNEHSACYMLTREQLKRAIKSGGFLVPPHRGKYDLLCSAATDPYTQCGMTKVICISHFEKFTLHHLPNAYIERLGCIEQDFDLQVNRLLEISRGEKSSDVLLRTEKSEPYTKWSKSYYESCSEELLNLIPVNARKVLSVGSGVGIAESKLLTRDLEVVCVPLDSVVSACTEKKGIRVSPANFDKACEFLSQERFDCILMHNIIQHIMDPIAILSKMQNLLLQNGVVIITAPNFNYYPAWVTVMGHKVKWWRPTNFDTSELHFATVRLLKRWINASCMKVNSTHFSKRKKINFKNIELLIPFKTVSSREIIVTASRSNP